MELADPAAPPWIAEDDILLKTAVESGASLEALEKGAVRFSRRYTLSEIRDQWHSLLYGPHESTRSSFRMSEVENSNSNKLWKIAGVKESEEKSTKRKTESIRRKYYATRKRIRGQPSNDNGLDFTNQVFYDYLLPVDLLMPNRNCLLGDHINTNTRLLEPGNETLGMLEPIGGTDKLKADTVNMKMLSNSDLIYRPESCEQEQHCFEAPISDGLVRLHSMGLLSPTDKEPLWKMTEYVPAPFLPISLSTRDKIHDREKRSNLPIEDHDCLLNANEGGLVFMDLDGSASADKSCYDNLNSLLLSSPIYSHGESGPHYTASVTKDGALPLAASVLTSPTNLDITTNLLKSEYSNHNDICLDAIISSPTSAQKARGLDNHDLDMPCLLNAEVEEVPNNDDIFSVEMTVANQSLSQNTNGKAPMILDMKVDNQSQPVFALGARPTTLLKVGLNHDTKSSIKARVPYTTAQGGKLFKNNPTVPDNGKAVKPSDSDVIGDPEGEAGHAEFKKPDTKFGQLVLPEQISLSISPDGKEPESEDDVPYFSDVEALVLEMDLCTYDQDPFTCARVSRYRDEDAKRQIMRLEQCARSFMDRRIESHSAFAILYGRRLKHYIKKPEVILGRATEDMEVDVDLAREGRDNKISRQQASIRLEPNGSFTVRNLGKFKISVNGMDLESGQYMTLSLSNLIEIRGMSFIFEVSHKLVQRFLSNARHSYQNQA